MKKSPNTTRREFLRTCVAGAAVLGASGALEFIESAEQGAAIAKPKVIIARDAMLRGSGSSVDSQRMVKLLDQSMQALFDGDRPAEPWKKLVRPGDRVGLKVNALGGRAFSSNLQLVEAVCERLQEAGIRAQDIVIWDRDTEELERAGFHIAAGGNRVQCFGTDQVGYEDDLVTYGSVGSRLSKILTRNCDILINLPVLKDHDGAGVSMALKNMYGVIHNPNKYHPNGCNPYIADVNMLPDIRARMRLTICDATTATYEGGPGYKPQYSWRPSALLAARDPVALDYVGWQMIERKRAEKGLKTLQADKRDPLYIATAADAQHRLGIDDPKRITLIELQADA
ncbi:MAG TPA: DUF362 domain-containing protein [Candidatus Binatia bacterium]|nr:DUF362 domain-containing protein [Candidatus Binatia bacterium]